MAKICVLGGGVCGWAAADYLSSKKHNVVIVEKENILGGAASNIFLDDGRIIPKAYHQIVGTDTSIIKALKNKNILNKIKWEKISIKFYINGTIIDLSNPIDLIRCDLLNFYSKLLFVIFGIKCLAKKKMVRF